MRGLRRLHRRRRVLLVVDLAVLPEPRRAGLDVTVVPLTEDDADAWAALRDEWSARTARRRLRDGHLGVGAFAGGRLVAAAWAARPRGADAPLVYESYTVPGARGHDVSLQLGGELLARLREDGNARALATTAPDNQVALRYYGLLGFRPL